MEFNVFPYSAYTRRQLRALYTVGAEHNQYYETTLFGKLEETLPAHELSVAYRTARAVGLAAGANRVVAVSALARQDPARARR